MEEEKFSTISFLEQCSADKSALISAKKIRIASLKEANEALSKKNQEYENLYSVFKSLANAYDELKGELGRPKNHFAKKEFAEYCGMSERTLEEYSQRTIDPLPYHQYETKGKIYFIPEECTAWFQRNNISRTKDVHKKVHKK